MAKQAPQRRTRTRWPEMAVVSGVMVVLIAAAALASQSGRLSIGAPQSQATVDGPATATAAATVYPATQTAVAASFPATMTALATEYADYPSAKATMFALEVSGAATALATSPPQVNAVLTATAYVPPTPEPVPTLRAGIDNETIQGPFSPAEFVVQNLWQGPVESPTQWLLVFAGAVGDPEGGDGPAALRVTRVTTTEAGVYLDAAFIGIFTAPTTSGPLTITAVNGDVLELRTEGGETLSFNLRSLQFQ